MNNRKIVLAITGASGSIYAQKLLKEFGERSNEIENLSVVFSDKAEEVWKHEIGEKFEPVGKEKLYLPNDFNAPFVSGSSDFDTMIICPCSMGTLGRIAQGISNDVITRTADVMLKERRKLILVARETPLNLIHIRNMETVTIAGGIICPAMPSFYQQPKSIDDLISTVTDRVLKLSGFEINKKGWGS